MTLVQLEHFKLKEFACSCCGKAKMDSVFLEKIDEARRLAGIPFKINSGYRCPKHNTEVGSTSKNHTSGKAADIAANNSQTRLKIVSALLKAGFKRIGISKTFIHADTMDSLDSMWLY